MTPLSKQFKVYDLVYREGHFQKRAKKQDTFTGPHMILKVISDSTLAINSDKTKRGKESSRRSTKTFRNSRYFKVDTKCQILGTCIRIAWLRIVPRDKRVHKLSGT